MAVVNYITDPYLQCLSNNDNSHFFLSAFDKEP